MLVLHPNLPNPAIERVSEVYEQSLRTQSGTNAMGFLRRGKKPVEAEPVQSHAVDLGSSENEDSDSGSDASCSAREWEPSVYNEKKALHSSQEDWRCTVRPSRRGFFLHASTSIVLPVSAAAAFDLFFGGSILPWRHFEVGPGGMSALPRTSKEESSP